ncbi:DNA-binding protein [Ralstonia pickettii]|uniref:DNA-binding protein n=1 Tax=Ralstonia pickettii TaxID=329 RepID=UPI00081887EB|nr:DNA-binding protein [Ralstonia pickettii]NWK46966.1 DNA-binding protein [Ralstonia pickettii]OCS45029.1 DNA-binding protein [Ralstonia pickettii]
MARPGLHFSAEQQQRIIDAIQRLDIAFPHDNAVFLDEVIEAVQAVTRRIYGVRRYVQWLTEAGVRRRPSNTTLQKAVDRAQGRGSAARSPAADSVEPWPIPLHAETGTLSAREEQNRIASRAIGAPGAGAEWMEARIRAEVAERALEHESARNRQLQAAMADLERRLGEALATAPAVPPKLTDETLERLERTMETVTRLEGAASALAGTERFLRLQNDAVRQQTQNEADQLRQRIRTLEAEVAQLNAQIDAYRRTAERAAPVSRGWVKPSS